VARASTSAVDAHASITGIRAKIYYALSGPDGIAVAHGL